MEVKNRRVKDQASLRPARVGDPNDNASRGHGGPLNKTPRSADGLDVAQVFLERTDANALLL